MSNYILRTPVFIAVDTGGTGSRDAALLRACFINGFSRDILDMSIRPTDGLTIDAQATSIHSIDSVNVFTRPGLVTEADAAATLLGWLTAIEGYQIHGVHARFGLAFVNAMLTRAEAGTNLRSRDAVEIQSAFMLPLEAGIIAFPEASTPMRMIELMGATLGVPVPSAPNVNALDTALATRRIWFKLLKLVNPDFNPGGGA